MSSVRCILGVNGASGKPLHLCPNCGAFVRDGTWIERFSEQSVRNVWICATCEGEFETPVALSGNEKHGSIRRDMARSARRSENGLCAEVGDGMKG